MNVISRFLSVCFRIGLLSLLGGCASYRLGDMLPEGIETVHVPIVKNDTEEPLLKNDVTSALLAEIQQDGSLRIEDRVHADAVLEVRITGFTLVPLSYAADNRERPNEYRLLLKARAELIRRSTGEVVVRTGELEGRNTFRLVGDLTLGKRQGLPGASEDLARHIVSAVTEAWPDEE